MVPRLSTRNRSADADATRPRVEGEREEEILEAAVSLLLDVGYDRLTMDGVAQRAKASKATLYRRWESKQALVVDAVLRTKRTIDAQQSDTGTLRGDLLQVFCGHQGDNVTDDNLKLQAATLTALQVNPEFAAEFRDRVLAPKIANMRGIYERAAQRGELAPGVDPSLLGPALAGILLHRSFLIGEPITPDLVARVVDQIILPAATGRHPSTTPPMTQEHA